MPDVSVIMPLFNGVEHIQESIGSVIRQNYRSWQLLVIDDGSTDAGPAIVEELSKRDDRIKLVSLYNNSGAAAARNAGMEIASGRYIAFLDSDDLWLPEKLEKQIFFMHVNKVAFSFSAYEKIDNKGRAIGSVGVPERIDYKNLLKTCVIGCLTAMYDTQILGKFEMPLIRKRQDFGLWLRILKKTSYAYGLPEVLAQYRVHDNSISSNKLSAASYTWRLYRDIEKLSLIESSYYFSHYAMRGVLRHRYPTLARKLGVLH